MPPVTMVDELGNAYAVDPADVAFRRSQGWTVEGAVAGAERVAGAAEADAYSGLGDQVDTYGAAVWRGATGGLSDAAIGAIGGDETRRLLRKQREANPLTSTVGEAVGGIAGAASGVGPVGKAAELGARVARAGEGAGALARIGRAAAGSAIEGTVVGAGEGFSDLMLSEDPLTVERALSTLSSKALYGAGIGAAAGTLGKSAEIGLTKAKGILDDVAARYSAGAGPAQISDDLARLDARGLAAAERAEREAIEAARVTQRAQVADELIAFRREIKQQKHAILTKDVDLPAAGEKLGARELGRIAVKANKQLDNLLDNPVGLAKNPAKALDALQRQENALAKVLERADDLRPLYAADKSGARAAALDTVAPALERNRALQARIGELVAEPASPRLTQIAAAKEALAGARGPQSLAEQMAGSTVFSTVTGAVAAIPLPGTSLLAPMIGARAANMIGEKVFGRLGKAATEGQARALRAVGSVFERGARAAKAAPPVATRVLASVAFGPLSTAEPGAPSSKRLPELYKERAAELREQVAVGPMGTPVVRPHARQRIAAQLAPIAAAQPLLADRMETLAVRRLEFLADKMPRRPDIGGIPMGPDRWQPTDMEMRTWARYVAAVEDPDGILERVAAGTVTPEDAEVMREVYPEMLADFTGQVLERLPELRQTLPYHRRLALSMLTGVPVDASMEPRILAALQSQYTVEPEPPRASPQFGSVRAKNEVGTPSERREQRM